MTAVFRHFFYGFHEVGYLLGVELGHEEEYGPWNSFVGMYELADEFILLAVKVLFS